MSRRSCRKSDCFCAIREDVSEEMDANVRAVKQGTDYVTTLSDTSGSIEVVRDVQVELTEARPCSSKTDGTVV